MVYICDSLKLRLGLDFREGLSGLILLSVEDLSVMRRFFISCLFVLLSLPILAQANVVLNPDHPQSYRVVKGDTLWDISGVFLKHPWHWPDIWQANAQIENPHLIYPGDVLNLVYRNGKPVLELARGPLSLSPQMRETALKEAIPTIPLDAISAFLSRPTVVDADVLATAPYVVAAADERLISASGDRVYIKNIDASQGRHYSVFRGGKTYLDPITQEVLGYEAIHAADATLSAVAEVSTAVLKGASQEVIIGDRLLAIPSEQYAANFFPHIPTNDIEGQIISVFDGVSQVGQFQIVVLNRGEREGLEVGHALSVYRAGAVVRDTVSIDPKDSVTLPDVHAGIAMVFKIFEKVSYAVIMKASRVMHVGDKVRPAN